MDYTGRPDYARVVDITTRAALREMMAARAVAVATPIIVGIPARLPGRGRFADVGTIAESCSPPSSTTARRLGQRQKYIESGHLLDADGKVLGKGTPAHAAAVVGDTVGDPFKDTAGPSLHVLVKLLATITLVMAPLFIR